VYSGHIGDGFYTGDMGNTVGPNRRFTTGDRRTLQLAERQSKARILSRGDQMGSRAAGARLRR
jgi:hypothetical protein